MVAMEVKILSTFIFVMNFVCSAFSPSLLHSRMLRMHVKESVYCRAMRLFSKLDDLMMDVEGILENPSNQTILNGGWVSLDPNSSIERKHKPSPIEEKEICGRRVYIKRDDLLRLHGSHISGNKARKMLAMNEIPAKDFPTCLVSYGGPQSNSMLALSAIVNYKNREAKEELEATGYAIEVSEGAAQITNQTKQFIYYTKSLPRFLRNQPSGNLFRALALGMELKELSQEEYNELFGGDSGGSPAAPIGLNPPVPGSSLWVPQGGAFGMAAVGASLLAEEIFSFWSETGNGKGLTVCLPGGTCSTAVLLHLAMKKLVNETKEMVDIEVVVVPCVGSSGYARRQMMALSVDVDASTDDIPTILMPEPQLVAGTASKYYPFGQPNKVILETFEMLRNDHGVVVDLMYGAPTWTIMLKHWNETISPDLSFDPNNPIAGREILYVNCGGQEGINSQLLRYKHSGFLSTSDIQLPGRSNRE